MEILNTIWAYGLVALGLGLVVFIHELGHFLVAKRAGVKVETFSIGFGPVIFGVKRGETRYVISALPLGGYVMMLGEDGTNEGEKSTDPRAFQNKPVGARMAIMAAGVIMNVILGLACFVVAYKLGMNYTPPIVGGVIPGSPAYEAGIKVGERIISVDGREATTFRDLTTASAVTGKNENIRLELEDPVSKRRRTLTIQPSMEKGDMFPTIGVMQPTGLKIGIDNAQSLTSPGLEKPMEGLQNGDRIVACGPEGKPLEPIKTIQELQRIEGGRRSEPLVVEVERKASEGKGKGKGLVRVPIVLAPLHVVDLGLRMTIGPIAALRPDSPAEKAGFKKGDRIVAFEGDTDFDPQILPLLCRDRAGKPTKFTVERVDADGDGKTKTTVELVATPDESFPWTGMPGRLLDLAGLGLCYPIEPRLAGVEPGSAADKMGLKAGDIVTSIAFTPPNDSAGKPVKTEYKNEPIDLVNGRKGAAPPNWVTIHQFLQRIPIGKVTLVIAGRPAPIILEPERSATMFNPIRGLPVSPLSLILPPQSVPTAIRLGLESTRESVSSVLLSIRGLFTGRVSTESMAGPFRIFPAVRESVDEGFSTFIHMLGLLSVNLAVINFLPIPPLDGGRFLFLLAEKIRGRPLPEPVLNGVQFAGMLFVFGLMAFVIFQDIKISVWH